MGLQNRNSNTQYVRLKDGKFFLGKDLSQAYDELEGTIVNMYYKNEEYEGVPQRKLIVVLQDGGDNYQLNINVDTSNYSTFVSFLKGADLSKPLTVHPKLEVSTKDGKEVKRYALLVSQNGKYNKSYFTKEVSEKLGVPKWDVVVVGKKKVTDKSNYLEFLEDFVTSNYINALDAKQTSSGGLKPSSGVESKRIEDDIFDTDDVLEANPWD